MLNILFEGIILGLLVSISIGPAFFAMIQTGIDRGFRYGFFMALGILVSDITLISILYLGSSTFFDNDANKFYIGLIGGIVLIGFGLYTFTKKPEVFKRRNPNYKKPKKEPTFLTFVVKGYFLNILNPFLIIFWLAALGFVSANAKEGELLNYTLTFFSGTLATIFAADLLKSYIGNKIKKYMRLRYIFWVNRIIGMLLIVFGIILIGRVFINF